MDLVFPCDVSGERNPWPFLGGLLADTMGVSRELCFGANWWFDSSRLSAVDIASLLGNVEEISAFQQTLNQALEDVAK